MKHFAISLALALASCAAPALAQESPFAATYAELNKSFAQRRGLPGPFTAPADGTSGFFGIEAARDLLARGCQRRPGPVAEPWLARAVEAVNDELEGKGYTTRLSLARDSRDSVVILVGELLQGCPGAQAPIGPAIPGAAAASIDFAGIDAATARLAADLDALRAAVAAARAAR